MTLLFLHTVFSYLAMYINQISFLSLLSLSLLPGPGVIVGPVLSVLLLIIAVTVTVITVICIAVHFNNISNRVTPKNVGSKKNSS